MPFSVSASMPVQYFMRHAPGSIGCAVWRVGTGVQFLRLRCHLAHTVLVVLKRHWVVLERRHTTNRCADPDWSSVDILHSDAGSLASRRI
jgi:hypothetical protein